MRCHRIPTYLIWLLNQPPTANRQPLTPFASTHLLLDRREHLVGGEAVRGAQGLHIGGMADETVGPAEAEHRRADAEFGEDLERARLWWNKLPKQPKPDLFDSKSINPSMIGEAGRRLDVGDDHEP